jgi:hypothetical protein
VISNKKDFLARRPIPRLMGTMRTCGSTEKPPLISILKSRLNEFHMHLKSFAFHQGLIITFHFSVHSIAVLLSINGAPYKIAIITPMHTRDNCET